MKSKLFYFLPLISLILYSLGGFILSFNLIPAISLSPEAKAGVFFSFSLLSSLSLVFLACSIAVLFIVFSRGTFYDEG